MRSTPSGVGPGVGVGVDVGMSVAVGVGVDDGVPVGVAEGGDEARRDWDGEGVARTAEAVGASLADVWFATVQVMVAVEIRNSANPTPHKATRSSKCMVSPGSTGLSKTHVNRNANGNLGGPLTALKGWCCEFS